MQHTGYLRHLLLRRGVTTGEILIHLVTTSQEEHDLEPLKDLLLALPLEGKIVGIMHIINDSLSDVVKSDETRILYGQDWFYENLLGLRFWISTFSFFQPNSLAAEVLYSIVRTYVEDARGMEVFDLYSGTGTIAQLLAPVAKEVIGVEIVEEAVEAARQNAALNGLSNCRFIAGDVLKVLDDLEVKPDMIVLDPPREGIHPKALPKILSYGVKRIVYVSCKATSLARDMETFLHAGYRLEKSLLCRSVLSDSLDGGCGGICQGVIGMENKVERKKKFIINVVFYALIAVLVWVGCKYLVSPMMPFIIAFLVAALIQVPVRKFKVSKKGRKSFCLLFFVLYFTGFCFCWQPGPV